MTMSTTYLSSQERNHPLWHHASHRLVRVQPMRLSASLNGTYVDHAEDSYAGATIATTIMRGGDINLPMNCGAAALERFGTSIGTLPRVFARTQSLITK